jgi:hypothetical protein
MPTSMRRPVPRAVHSKHRGMNLQSLQLMFRSGVVRREDAMPLPLLRIFGPQPQSALTRRS